MRHCKANNRITIQLHQWIHIQFRKPIIFLIKQYKTISKQMPFDAFLCSFVHHLVIKVLICSNMNIFNHLHVVLFTLCGSFCQITVGPRSKFQMKFKAGIKQKVWGFTNNFYISALNYIWIPWIYIKNIHVKFQFKILLKLLHWLYNFFYKFLINKKKSKAFSLSFFLLVCLSLLCSSKVDQLQSQVRNVIPLCSFKNFSYLSFLASTTLHL